MMVRIFESIIQYDPSAPARTPSSVSPAELNVWLAKNPDIKVRHLVQSQTYKEPTPMTCGVLRIATTVFYD